MAVVQSTYGETMRAGLPGMVANAETQNVITRTNVAAAAIAFGMPVMRSGDHGCVLGSAETLAAVGAAGVPVPTGATISAAPVVSAGAKEGVYHVTAITGGATNTSRWEVEDPDGNPVGIASGTVAFSAGGLAFTIAVSGTPVVGDQFLITVAPTVGTADLDVLGISVRDASLDVSNSDTFKRYDSVPVMTLGVIFVTSGGVTAAGSDVYWNATSGRFTSDTGDVKLTGWKFEMAGTDGSLTKIARR